MPVWVVANAFKSQAMKAIKAAGGGKTGLDKVRKSNPNWFTYKTKAGSTPAKAKPKAKSTIEEATPEQVKKAAPKTYSQFFKKKQHQKRLFLKNHQPS